MAQRTVDRVSETLAGVTEHSQDLLDSAAEAMQGRLTAVLEAGGEPARRVKDALNGVWLGHPLHPALTDLPIGAWTLAAVFDLFGGRQTADRLVTAGVIAAVPTALSGISDWHDLSGTQRRTGLIHGMVNSLGLTAYVGSMLARRSGRRGAGVALSTVGFALAVTGAYLGGDLTFAEGTNVRRTAWDPSSDGFRAVARLDEVSEGVLFAAKTTVDGQEIPIVLLRRGQNVMALHGRCVHQGGPLAEGRLVDGDCVECPWHASTFEMATGAVVHGPAPYPQPRFEARIRDGQVEVQPRL